MKKFLLVFSVIAIMLSVFTACNADMHEHTFASEWSTDEDYHWHACTAADGCTEQDSKAAHDFEVVVDKNDKPMNKCKVCGYTNDKVSTAPEHEHVFEDKYSSNENFHWYACTVENCYEKGEKTEHAFGNPEVEYTDGKITITSVCVDCEYKKVEEQNVDTEIKDEISWDQAFKSFEPVNYTLDVYFEMLDGSATQHNHCEVTPDSIFYSIPDYHEFYSIRNSDGKCVTYQKYGDDETPYTLLSTTSDMFLVRGKQESIIKISFEENFEKFTYDEATGSYVCDETITAKYIVGEHEMEFFCYNNVVKITDGKISYISANYYFEEEELSYQKMTLIYSNIDLTSVEIPQSVINNALEDENPPEYYEEEFDNSYNEGYEDNRGEYDEGYTEEDSYDKDYNS